MYYIGNGDIVKKNIWGMKMKYNLISLSVLCLAISIVIGSWFISKGLSNENKVKTESHLLNQNQIANYLGINKEQVSKLMSKKGREIENGIPYIKVGNDIYFDKKAVSQWIQKYQILAVE